MHHASVYILAVTKNIFQQIFPEMNHVVPLSRLCLFPQELYNEVNMILEPNYKPEAGRIGAGAGVSSINRQSGRSPTDFNGPPSMPATGNLFSASPEHLPSSLNDLWSSTMHQISNFEIFKSSVKGFKHKDPIRQYTPSYSRPHFARIPCSWKQFLFELFKLTDSMSLLSHQRIQHLSRLQKHLSIPSPQVIRDSDSNDLGDCE